MEPRRNILCDILGILCLSEEAYRMRQFECGMAFIEGRCTDADARRLSQDNDFWAWWRMTWEVREQVMLVKLERSQLAASEAAAHWDAIHALENLVEKVPDFIDRRKAQ